tara:strand:- start:1107 stop:1859 length:753 start_codon:yes stop_codon:yes gene_type:complete
MRLFVTSVLLLAAILSTPVGAQSKNAPLPPVGVMIAYDLFRAEDGKVVTDEIIAYLRRDALRLVADGTVEENRQVVAAEGYSLPFIGLFEEALVWAKDIADGDPADAYAAAKELRQGAKDQPFASLKRELLRIALRKGHPDALWDDSQEKFKSPEHLYRSRAQSQLQRLANGGDLRAALDLAQRHRLGDILPQKADCALYWYLKAATLGAGEDITPFINELSKQVTPRQRMKITFGLTTPEVIVISGCQL